MEGNTGQPTDNDKDNTSKSGSESVSERKSKNSEQRKIEIADMPKTNVNSELKMMRESENKAFDELIKENVKLTTEKEDRDGRIKELEEGKERLENNLKEEKQLNKLLTSELSSLKEELEILRSGASSSEEFRQLNDEIRHLQDRLKALAKEESDRDKKLRNYEAELLLQRAWNIKLERELGEEKLQEIKDVNTDEQVIEDIQIKVKKNVVYSKEPVKSTICSIS
ncbi:unnamed protein product [Dimorphilus gyrociliatus]|uniref:Uncharacterized protein n=1 Tax=Dimorphilus gyrociliatus TaxID=2664684 RepID=A0A7I8WCU3_9ANNE|nr:unnamed protein product [Dimorphilus gyrociliatus]